MAFPIRAYIGVKIRMLLNNPLIHAANQKAAQPYLWLRCFLFIHLVIVAIINVFYFKDKTYSLKYLYGKGITVSCPFRIKLTFISGSSLSNLPFPFLTCDTERIKAAVCSLGFIPVPQTPTK